MSKKKKLLDSLNKSKTTKPTQESTKKLSDSSPAPLKNLATDPVNPSSPPVSTSEPLSADNSFAAEVARSQAKLAEADAPKGKRGVKPGTTRGPYSKEGKPASPGGSPAQEPAIPPAVLAPVIKIPYALAARATGFAGFQLEDEIAMEIAPQLDMVLRTYLPAMESKHQALFGLCSTLGIVTVGKYMLYTAWKDEQEAKRQVSPTLSDKPPTSDVVNTQQNTGSFQGIN